MGQPVIHFEVIGKDGKPDVEAALAKAEGLGGARVFGPAPVPGTNLELGQLTDPEGHLIGLMKAAA